MSGRREGTGNNTKNIRSSDEEWALAGLVLANYPGGRSEAARDGIRRVVYEEIARHLETPVDNVSYPQIRDYVQAIRADRVARIRGMQEELVRIDMVLEYLTLIIRRQDDAAFRQEQEAALQEKRARDLDQMRRFRAFRQERFVERVCEYVSAADARELLAKRQMIRDSALPRGLAYAFEATRSFVLQVYATVRDRDPDFFETVVMGDDEAVGFMDAFFEERVGD